MQLHIHANVQVRKSKEQKPTKIFRKFVCTQAKLICGFIAPAVFCCSGLQLLSIHIHYTNYIQIFMFEASKYFDKLTLFEHRQAQRLEASQLCVPVFDLSIASNCIMETQICRRLIIDSKYGNYQISIFASLYIMILSYG